MQGSSNIIVLFAVQTVLAERESQYVELQEANRQSQEQLAAAQQQLAVSTSLNEASGKLPDQDAKRNHQGPLAGATSDAAIRSVPNGRGGSEVTDHLASGHPKDLFGQPGQLAELEQELARRAAAVAELHQAVAAKDAELGELKATSEAGLAALRQDVASLKKDLDAAVARAEGHYEALQDSSNHVQVTISHP